VVLYETRLKGISHALGTSGFLYRSNKLMYDKKTSSLWSTLHGTPVIGKLVGQDIKLKRRSVVTTTWGEWKKRHPKTTVLSLRTGHRRDYSEGNAYRSYFATDKLMFKVPKLDKRLPNKREVVALRTQDGENPIALDTEFLKKNPVYSIKHGEVPLVILTTRRGESRVYEAGQTTFKSWESLQSVIDKEGTPWQVREGALVTTDGKTSLKRYPSHQSFWFGWKAQFPDTKLIK